MDSKLKSAIAKLTEENLSDFMSELASNNLSAMEMFIQSGQSGLAAKYAKLAGLAEDYAEIWNKLEE